MTDQCARSSGYLTFLFFYIFFMLLFSFVLESIKWYAHGLYRVQFQLLLQLLTKGYIVVVVLFFFFIEGTVALFDVHS